MCNTNTAIIKAFWTCGDSQTINFAIMKARLNRSEKKVIIYILDEDMTQEEAAEHLNMSLRSLQNYWYSAVNKLIKIPWVVAYGKELMKNDKC
ncbi:MAG: hypothetical protein MJ097_06340 [Dorea sp.]|nr:hypothetical protein [Dorea sp.]